MKPDSGGCACWPDLAGRLQAAAAQAEEAARLAPPAGAEALLEALKAVGACLTEAERLCRAGVRERREEFGRELEKWAARMPVLRAWMGASSALAAGWAAAAGVGACYGPAGDLPERQRGGISELG